MRCSFTSCVIRTSRTTWKGPLSTTGKFSSRQLVRSTSLQLFDPGRKINKAINRWKVVKVRMRWENVFCGSVHFDGEENNDEFLVETLFYNHVCHQLNRDWLGFTLVLTYLVHLLPSSNGLSWEASRLDIYTLQLVYHSYVWIKYSLLI